jgi:hypothetical protein
MTTALAGTYRSNRLISRAASATGPIADIAPAADYHSGRAPTRFFSTMKINAGRHLAKLSALFDQCVPEWIIRSSRPHEFAAEPRPWQGFIGKHFANDLPHPRKNCWLNLDRNRADERDARDMDQFGDLLKAQWLQSHPRHRTLFHHSYCRVIGKEIPFDRVWGPPNSA